MDAITSIFEHFSQLSGINIPAKKMTEEEYIRFKCDSYNNLTGKKNELDGYDCQLCKNRANFAKPFFDGGIWTEVMSPCKCQPIRTTILRLKKSGLKNIITEYTFPKYNADEPWKQTLKSKAMSYAKNPGNSWFFLGGQNGCGKTHLCTAIAGHFLKAGKNVRYMLWRDDISKLKSCITDAEAYNKLMLSFKTADVLYIDDMFKNGKGPDGRVQHPTASDIQIAFELLNYRYNNKELLTIISSERLISELLELDEALGGRIAERSFDNGFCINIKPDKKKNYRIRNFTTL